jgi:hypothetical protein
MNRIKIGWHSQPETVDGWIAFSFPWWNGKRLGLCFFDGGHKFFLGVWTPVA